MPSNDLTADERRKHTVSVATEELRTRWAELVTLQTEMNRWRSLYLAALIGALGWLFTQSDPVLTIVNRHPQLLMALSIANALFAVWTTFNVWSIHQIGLYCYTELGQLATARADARLVTWDEWRRRSFGRDYPRIIFAVIANATPFGVSFVLFTWAMGSPHRALQIVVPAAIVSAGLLAYAASVTIWIAVVWKRTIHDRRRAEIASGSS